MEKGERIHDCSLQTLGPAWDRAQPIILAKTRPRHFDFLPSDVRTRTFEMRGLRNNCLVFVREILSQIFNQFVPTGSAVDSCFEFPPRDHPDGQPQNRKVTREPLSGFRCRKAGGGTV
jgi:hypothetical protein